jgi:hypothetical protein
MTEERVERRLTAILAADVAGYSRLMGAAVKALRRELVDPKMIHFADLLAPHRVVADCNDACEHQTC